MYKFSDDAIDHAVAVLNEAYKADPVAINSLFTTRASCNEMMANHDTIQVAKEMDIWSVGMIGIINGIFGADNNGCGYIAVIWNENTGKVEGFCRKITRKETPHG